MAMPSFRPRPSQSGFVEPLHEGGFARVHLTQRRDAQPKVAATAASIQVSQVDEVPQGLIVARRLRGGDEGVDYWYSLMFSDST